MLCASPLTSCQIREGFIIDDEEEEPENRERRHRHKENKRRRDEEEAILDEEDLDLIGEAIPEWERKTAAQVRGAAGKREAPLLTIILAQAQAPQAWPPGRWRPAPIARSRGDVL